MSQWFVQKSKLSGEIEIPPSKSHTLRAILLASLAHGISSITTYLPSPDTFSMIEACRLLGAKIEVLPDHLRIEGTGGCVRQAEDVIHAGNSGIVLRFCSAIAALSSHPIVITGDFSIRHQRPMGPLIEGLQQLGVHAISTKGDGYAPLIIQGPLKPGPVHLMGEDSQYVSALLMAAAFAEGITELHVSNPGEKPWVALTLHWLQHLGIQCEHDNFKFYRILGPNQYPGFTYAVPGDFSSAAFPLVAALVTGSQLTLKNLSMQDSQGDKAVLSVLQGMGANITVNEKTHSVTVQGGDPLKGCSLDVNDFIDAVPILATLACYAQGTTHLYHASMARHKECNRLKGMMTQLTKMGAKIEETEDGLKIEGGRCLHGATLESYHDHRLAMALTIAGLGAEGATIISPTECVAKTFPTFAKDFMTLGAAIHELD